ncbi:hypothetical protein Ade02nite_71210 [Paractinoplanes deccanensis]|uniref:Uncharacterized protein n=1 Tax=Paractinoplanes deccanensis TaxID=113561 RepID=A0ABQ3YF90_9ACTN|nr:hypothetical protein [Actinoplanes deccanensis]GID78480.1 hypothetical protein Ade02nite_71210 [Actinoplanes deccanensis]
MSGSVAQRRSAEVRTRLMHRMLLTRHFAERGAAVPLDGCRATFRPGEEAVAAGTWGALGPGDTVIRCLGNADRVSAPGVLICVGDTGAVDDLDRWLDAARRHDRRALAARLSTAAHGTSSPSGIVDALDAEAVLAAMRFHLDALRAGGPPRLVELRLGDADPVAALAARMFAQHQLDENALRAIDADTRAYVRAVLAAGPGGRP